MSEKPLQTVSISAQFHLLRQPVTTWWGSFVPFLLAIVNHSNKQNALMVCKSRKSFGGVHTGRFINLSRDEVTCKVNGKRRLDAYNNWTLEATSRLVQPGRFIYMANATLMCWSRMCSRHHRIFFFFFLKVIAACQWNSESSYKSPHTHSFPIWDQ